MIVGAVDEGGERSLLAGALPWTIARVPDCLQFLKALFRVRPHVVLCKHDLPDGSWRDIVGVVDTLFTPPPVIVVSQCADDRLWAEVLARGGYDAVAEPLEGDNLQRVLQMAWRHSSRLRQAAEASAETSEDPPGAMAT
jgi:FixJ family two-component response regulator